MKVFLMHNDKDFDSKQELPSNAIDLIQDLELDVLFKAMAMEDEFLFEIVKKALLFSLDEPKTIYYRQEILKDCLKNPAIIREIYNIPIEAIKNKQKHWMGIFGRYSSAILSSSVEILQMFVELLKKLRKITDEHSDKFKSAGFTRFFTMIKQELSDEYFVIVDNHLKELRFRNGSLISAKLGNGNEGFNYILRKPNKPKNPWLERIFIKKPPSYSFTLAPRDDQGAQMLGNLRNEGIALVANSSAQSAEHIESFLSALRLEFGFYICCLNLHERLYKLKEPIVFPKPMPSLERYFSCTALFDVALALTMNKKIVSNNISADSKDLVMITGSNQGGKSTFLRSIGLAQLMMQCGMFVCAESFCANVCSGIFTHYKREEDAKMQSGKFDEELDRMSGIIDTISPNALILFNESFAATNEREGSEIAKGIVSALLESNVKVFYVTHLYDLAQKLYTTKNQNYIFLRAVRKEDGTRTFKLSVGEPLQTSYGYDLYNRLFTSEISHLS